MKYQHPLCLVMARNKNVLPETQSGDGFVAFVSVDKGTWFGIGLESDTKTGDDVEYKDIEAPACWTTSQWWYRGGGKCFVKVDDGDY